MITIINNSHYTTIKYHPFGDDSVYFVKEREKSGKKKFEASTYTVEVRQNGFLMRGNGVEKFIDCVYGDKPLRQASIFPDRIIVDDGNTTLVIRLDRGYVEIDGVKFDKSKFSNCSFQKSQIVWGVNDVFLVPGEKVIVVDNVAAIIGQNFVAKYPREIVRNGFLDLKCCRAPVSWLKNIECHPPRIHPLDNPVSNEVIIPFLETRTKHGVYYYVFPKKWYAKIGDVYFSREGDTLRVWGRRKEPVFREKAEVCFDKHILYVYPELKTGQKVAFARKIKGDKWRLYGIVTPEGVFTLDVSEERLKVRRPVSARESRIVSVHGIFPYEVCFEKSSLVLGTGVKIVIDGAELHFSWEEIMNYWHVKAKLREAGFEEEISKYFGRV